MAKFTAGQQIVGISHYTERLTALFVARVDEIDGMYYFTDGTHFAIAGVDACFIGATLLDRLQD